LHPFFFTLESFLEAAVKHAGRFSGSRIILTTAPSRTD